MREALENELRSVLNSALNMLGTVERMYPIAADVLLHGRVERLEEIKAIDREVDAQEAQLEAECLRIIALHQPVARDLRLPVYEAGVVGYPKRMRDYNERRKREGNAR